MRGKLYAEKCKCGGSMIHDERRHNLFCELCGAPAYKGYIVRFGKSTKRFKTYQLAAQCLSGWRYKEAEGTFDPRDYQKDFPLGFLSQSEKWLETKKMQVKPSSWRNLNNYSQMAVKVWGNLNCKEITFGHLEDFLYHQAEFRTTKTRHNACSALHNFFVWLQKREGIPVPAFPECKFDLGYRTITTLEIQENIIEEIRRITSANPKIVFAVELLAAYPSLRPDDLRRVQEENYRNGYVTIHYPTKRKNRSKVVRLLPEHAEKWEALRDQYTGLPYMPYFRHHGGIRNCKEEAGFSYKTLYLFWKKACKNLGVEGVDLYGGTRHTTTTEMARIVGKEKTKRATGHDTNKAFERYCQAQDETGFEVARIMADRKKPAKVLKIKREEK